MRLTPVLIPLLLWLPSGHPFKTGRVVAASPPPTHERIGGWSLTVRRDAFVGQATCRIARGRQSYERQALVLRLPSNVDTSGAIYRIDWGSPIPAAADRAAIASLGFALWQDNLSNPSGGLIRVPYTKLTTAHALQVEAYPGGRVWSFSLDGLSAAVAAAKAAGCI